MLLFGVAVLVVLVVSVVDFHLLAFLVLGGWGWRGGVPVVLFSVTALRLVLVL